MAGCSRKLFYIAALLLGWAGVLLCLAGPQSPAGAQDSRVLQIWPDRSIGVTTGLLEGSTVHATTHHDPVYLVDGIVHCGIANLPGAVPRTSTMALTNATLPYVLAIADSGWRAACRRDTALARGVNMVGGRVTYRAVAEASGEEYCPLELAVD